MRMKFMRHGLAALSIVGSGVVFADEGMWTFNHFPAAQVRQKYGFEPDAAWLDHLRLASMRLAGGCSGSVVSRHGLVMTNHHCARGCIEMISGLQRKDYDRDGFLAATRATELRCPGMELNQLIEIVDVTGPVQDATRDIAADRFAEVQKRITTTIEQQCATSDELRCEVVSLFRGGRYELYRYRRLQDIRLVFAPEAAIADFGGDPDNFMFPRYDLDVAFVRIYGPDGRPLPTEHFLAWSDGTLREGDLTFVSGHPGGTSRSKTLAQIDDERDVRLPRTMTAVAELRGYLSQYQQRGAEQHRHSTQALAGIENWLKAMKGQHAALTDPVFHAQLARDERVLRERVAADPVLEQTYGPVWQRIATLVRHEQALRTEYTALERGPSSRLFELARGLVRHADEIGKPNGERLKEYSDARLPQFRQTLLAARPIYDELEIATLGWSLAKLRENLGPDHPTVRRILGRRSPADVARTAVVGSRLENLQLDDAGTAVAGERLALYTGGKAAVDASDDPMILLARAYDGDARAIRRRVETEVEGPMQQQQEQLARVRAVVLGNEPYPDATFTLRLSYGSVRGYTEEERTVGPFTTLGGAFERHTGAEPYALPVSWLDAKPRLRLDLPMNFVTTNDIIGGNSGSPVVNQRAEIVGLIFDGNRQSLGGEFGFDAAQNRAVAVHSAALLEALDKVYGARSLVEELGQPPTR
ncbi:MAG: S46 family peptidase [Burkholderiaceae bacterium]